MDVISIEFFWIFACILNKELSCLNYGKSTKVKVYFSERTDSEFMLIFSKLLKAFFHEIFLFV